ncbi:MAG: hypothetical protein KBT46_09385, partial [Ruminococcus sp.]|nr:hypothetical protein [Candidatus Copronaster equi]
MKNSRLLKKVLSVLISIIMIVSSVVPCLFAANAAVWNGGMSTPSLISGVYQIATAENLAWFANAVNTGSQSIKAKLTANIQLNSSGSKTNVWTPIGTADRPFKGTFDGNEYTISGMYVNSENNNQGLFGCVALPEVEYTGDVIDPDLIVQTTTVGIQNVKVTGSEVIGNQNVGGIVGYGIELGVKNCSYQGTVRGTSNSVGGIIGWASSNTAVTECITSGTVQGKQRVGGIAGYQNGNAVVNKSYSSCDITGTQNVGGITGTLSASYLEGCFCLGSVTANDRVGGIVGYSAFGTVKSVYASASINTTGTEAGGAVGTIYDGTYGSVFYDFSVAGVDGPVGSGRTTDEMQSSSFLKDLNAAKIFFCFDYTNINSGFPVLVWMLATDLWLGELSIPQKSGTTYLISKPSELAWFGALVNGTLNGYDATPSANARVTADLLLNINVNSDDFSIVEWTPIGTAEHPYTGTFDGGGYNIAGIYTSTEAGLNRTNVGLFGYVGTGTVKNTVVIDGKIQGVENVGGIAGYLFGGTIQNCCCSSEVCGDRAVGGIVGNIGNTSTTKVNNCCMLGTITGTNVQGDESYLQNVGGIVGYNNRSTVSQCFTFGKINAPLARNVGGLIGNNSSGALSYSYNTSLLVNGRTLVGGIVGYNNNGSVSYAYTAGKVSGTGSSKIGIAFGEVVGTVSSCYYDSAYVSASNTVSSATAKTSVQMTGSSSVSNLGLGTSYFKATADDTYFFYYPQISALSNSSCKVIKNGSLDSAKRVQDKYNARVQVDGRADTYYETISDAVNYASGVSSIIIPTVYIVRDVDLTSTINVTGEVRMYAQDSMVLRRTSAFTGTMFNVTGSLTIGSNVYGNDDTPDFEIDGNAVAGTASAITVSSTGTLNIEKGVKLCNITTVNSAVSPIRGAVILNNKGNVNISGGVFGDMYKENRGYSTGGVIYNTEGNVTISGGKFEFNRAVQGAIIYNNNGIAVISGGTFTSNTGDSKGGVSVSYGIYAVTTITGKAMLSGNTSIEGAAINAQNYSTTEISGGTICDNIASATGGAAQSETGAELIISGGNITGNRIVETAKTPMGSGIYNASSLILKADAQIDSSNDVYLVSGKKITIEDRLTCYGYAATITPANYTEGLVVLDGSAMSTNYQKIGVSNPVWHTLANGKISTTTASTVAIVSKTGANSVEYITLTDAFASIKSGEEGIITLVNDVDINSVIKVNGDVTLLCDDGATHKMTRAGSFQGIMFDITSGSTLRLGESVNDADMQSRIDYENGTDSNEEGLIIIDGGKTVTGVVGTTAVNVPSNANFYMHEGSVIQNCTSTTSGTVALSGNMYFYGGTIRNNTGLTGGAINVKSTGKLFTYGGVIANNTATRYGSAIYSLGKVTRCLNTYNYYYVETLYNESGEIIGQSDPVLKGTKQSDILIKHGDTVYLSTNIL